MVHRRVRNMIDEQTLMETHWRETIADYDVPQTIILASHLGVDMDEAQHYIDSEDFLVLTDEHADEYVREEIEEMVWAFSPSFLSVHTKVSEEAIRKIQESMYEDANESLTGMIKDLIGLLKMQCVVMGEDISLQVTTMKKDTRTTYQSRNGRCYETKKETYFIYRRN